MGIEEGVLIEEDIEVEAPKGVAQRESYGDIAVGFVIVREIRGGVTRKVVTRES